MATPTLLDAFELLPPGCDKLPSFAPRPRMPSVVIDVEWEEPVPSSASSRLRVWATED